MAEQFIIEPTKAELLECSISGLNYVNNFHVQELRIYEDICKVYFTGQLIIEAHLNTSELYLNPGAQVIISFEAPRTTGSSQVYTENFRIYSYESKPREGDITGSMVITISLIGDEYYNDKTNTVLQNFSNLPGTAAATAIHEQYIAENGGMNLSGAALGMIGQSSFPHQVLNKKPIKAIHDILDKCVFAPYNTCAPIYFRNKRGYEMGPLQHFLENAPETNKFYHKPGEGATIFEKFNGYENIINLRPMSPAGEDNGGVRGAELDNLFKKSSFFDVKSGNYLTKALSGFGSMMGTSMFQDSFDALKDKVKGKYGGRLIFYALDELRQPRAIDKNGPGGFNTAEDAFLAALTYSEKYWVSVPLQSGINTTCGDRITIRYPIGIKPNPQLVEKTLFVPRLIHELRFTEGPNRKQVSVTGTTDIYGVFWE